MSGGARRDKAGPPGVLVGAAMGPAAAAQSKSACWCLGSHDGREMRLERKDFFFKKLTCGSYVVTKSLNT